MKKLFTIALFSLALAGLYAQNAQEYAKQREQKIKALKEAQQKGVQTLKSNYQDYVKEQDEKFSEFLRERWSEFDVFTGVKIPDKPKPVEPPCFNPDDCVEKVDPVKIKFNFKNIVLENELPDLEPVLQKIPMPEKTPQITDGENVQFNFFGADVSIKTDNELKNLFSGEISENTFADYWDKMTNVKYQETVNQLIEHYNILKLNDWAYYMLVNSYSEQIHPNDKNSSEMLAWFLLIKSGYKAKIGYSNNDIVLLLPAEQLIYSYEYINISGLNYYMPQPSDNSLYTYEKDFEGASKTFRLDFAQALELPGLKENRNLDFRYHDKEYSLSIDYNKNLVSFYNQYPPVKFKHYFNAPVSKLTAESLANQLSPLIKNLSEKEQAELLLKLLHQAFPYKTDNEQFGKEKYFFVEDIFSYPYSDCEDRSVLYSYLVQSLAGLNSIGLHSPNHIFTAVALKDTIGDYIDFNGKPYTICDPTYIGASIGDGMPEAIKDSLDIIPVNTRK